ncbi:hypothetical protein GAY33_10565 [Azospirillum brasilense]|uniref:hypothetical protein n=1 Tax=Azospirillum argentinense TaxID=2970906 RepID=UPI00190C753A|nr:hypothetical protein [Azospirillum argentinense]MBK3799668.1 hypothetical protein [Azospirillum argentinense]
MTGSSRLVGWLLWLVLTVWPFKTALWIGCGFDVLNTGHYAYVWAAFLAGARFHTPAQILFLLSWPALLLWCWATLVALPLPTVFARLLDHWLDRRARRHHADEAPTPADDGLPSPFAGLGTALPAPPPVQAVRSEDKVMPPLPSPLAMAVVPAHPAPHGAPQRSPAAPRPPAPPPVPADEYRPPDLEAPLSVAELAAILDLVPDERQRDELRDAIARVDPELQATMTAVVAVSAAAQMEHDRICEAQGKRPALATDVPCDDPEWMEPFLEGLQACNTAVWELNSYDGSNRGFVALGGSGIAVILAWTRPGPWIDRGDRWTGAADAACLSPVLGVDILLKQLLKTIDGSPETANRLTSCQAIVLMAEGTIVPDEDTERRWDGKSVQVCTLAAGDRMSLMAAIGPHQRPPDDLIAAALDRAGLKRLSN